MIPDLSVDTVEQVGTREIRQGDAFQLIEQIDDASVDLIITSPPYWGHRTYGLEHNWNILREWEEEHTRWEPPPWEWYRDHGGVLGLEPLPEWYVENLVSFFSGAIRKLKDHGSVWVNVGDTYFARWASIRDEGRQGLGNNGRVRRRTPMGRYLQEKQLLLIPSRFAIAMENERWILRNDMIWFKPNVPPRPEKDRLRLAHEHFFHFVKKPKEGRKGKVLLRSFRSGGLRTGCCPVQRTAGQERPFSHVPDRAHQAADPELLSFRRSRSRPVLRNRVCGRMCGGNGPPWVGFRACREVHRRRMSVSATNFISEWYGVRLYPSASGAGASSAIESFRNKRCPFPSSAL